ncbi:MULTISPECIES: GntR family transcriptional regulator [Cobetia]|uniref:GntR family transcriptional regulator n=1 Tax=Cobetia TaxID=204286 RepID=UPI00159DDB10|nr:MULTISPECIES: GntR family transcriptional regulator [Cobetia]MBE2167552.1 GntR family transcriptional regulator [Cobetia sp. 2AS1]MCK8066911.1 GntR family transcriptional regulator [Cobetia sp. 1CM21F]MDH2447002.1 GntR family transcriptional regulator [Cobetia sp. 2AS]UBU47572.1 GntR family transcriptional regulator [Cobetia amphilecti]
MNDFSKLHRPDTLWSGVAEQIQDLIASGTLVPGMKLTEAYLSKALGVSRVPVREALRHLLSTGLLVSEPYKGVRVRHFDHAHLAQLYAYRAGLERMAFNILWPIKTVQMTDELIRRQHALSDAIGRRDSEGAIIAELHLHGWCHEVSGNEFLLADWERIRPHLQCYFVLHQRAHQRPGPSREAHDRYVALATGDSLPDMLAHIDEHMHQGMSKVLELVE